MKLSEAPANRFLLAAALALILSGLALGLLASRLAPPAPRADSSLAFHLLDGRLNAAQAAARPPFLLLQHLQSGPLLTLADITFYDPETFELGLTPAAVERLARLEVPMSGLPFVVLLNGWPAFTGAFWSSLSSQSFEQAVVIDVLPLQQTGSLHLSLGYPASSDRFRGQDWRRDPRFAAPLPPP
jgi:hypothetical protein